ncbi:hypothetical protein CR194_08055 [Salipaludibacillus keqinensis]|uniref:Flagellar hook-length control protein-like C-terminal domain-containing protein n=1 Tax=Salipaludibacillus keqinensis TaxID=2045207 RepID=A0A323TKJ1_9BACI|nr:flagellar hook-length control protein FliK [Salipaludibacillus keqinensis]PYZ93143.1 hypothetical protein CR194_08055 [Salipaludibacillus keqinensis]
MNGMMAMRPMLQLNHLGKQGELTLNSSEEEGNDTFLTLLGSLMNVEGDSEEEMNGKTQLLKEMDLAPELMELLSFTSLEELVTSLNEEVEKLSNVIEELPLDESFLSDDMLHTAEMKAFIEVMPDQWAEEFEQLFHDHVSLEGLIEDFERNGDPVHLLAVISTFSVKENQLSPLENERNHKEAWQALKNIVSAFFPKLIQEDKSYTSLPVMTQEGKGQGFQQLMTQVKGLFENRQGMLNTSSPGRLDGHVLNTNRFAELAYVNQLASTSNPANTEVKAQPLSMMLDTTNSQMARFQTVMVPSGESNPERPSQEQFLRQFQNLLSRSSFQQLSKGVQQLNLKLHPASLGRMDITIQQVNGVMMATLMTTTKVARDLVDGQLSQLRNAFQGQNIQVDKIEVTQQQTQQQLLKDSNQESAKKEHEQQDSKTFNEDEEEDDLDFAEFLENTINTEA